MFSFLGSTSHSYRILNTETSRNVSVFRIRDDVLPYKFIKTRFDTVPFYKKYDSSIQHRAILGFIDSEFMEERYNEIRDITKIRDVETMTLSSWIQYANIVNMPLVAIAGGRCDIQTKKNLWDIMLYYPKQSSMLTAPKIQKYLRKSKF